MKRPASSKNASPRSPDTEPARPRPATGVGHRRLIRVLRVSKRQGRQGDSFLAPDQQRDVTDDYVGSTGDTIIDTIDETDSVSGGSVNRSGLQSALRRIHGGEADGLIVANARRFARTRRAGEAAIYDLVEAGKSFVAVKERIDSAGGKLDRMAEKWLVDTLMSAQWEREDLQANWLDVRQRHIAGGRATHACYGYRKRTKEEGDAGRLVIVPAQAKWVRFIFRQRAAGWSWARITDALNEKEVPPPPPVLRKVEREEPQPRATRWHHNQVHRMVDNPTYRGQLRSGKIVNHQAHKEIITADLWERAHAVHTTATRRGTVKGKVGAIHQKRPKAEFLLTGLVFCATCGGRMQGQVHKVPPSKAKPHGFDVRYYVCRRRQPWGVCPRPARCKADELEKLVRGKFEARYIHGDGFVVESDPINSQVLANARAELAEAEAELTSFVENEAIAQMTRALGPENFDRGVATRTKRVLHAQADLKAIDDGAEVRSAVLGLVEDWPRRSVEQMRLALSAAIVLVVVAAPKAMNAQVPVGSRWDMWWRGDASAPVPTTAKMQPIELP